jgi:NADH-quinone oxidoreductase subunit J
LEFALLIVLLAGLVVTAAVCIMIRDLIKAALMMAVMSATLSIIMFVYDAPLAAVFELSVCAVLITVIFISAINMSTIRSKQENIEMDKTRRKQFIVLPILLASLALVMLLFLLPQKTMVLPHATVPTDLSAQSVLWNSRQVELLGLIVIILTGVSGVIVFFKEEDSN